MNLEQMIKEIKGVKNVESNNEDSILGPTYSIELNTNNKDTKFLIIISKTEYDLSSKHALPNLWVKHGFMDKPVSTSWHISTYRYDENGHCWGGINPTITKDHKVNFENVKEATEEHFLFLIKETIKQYGEM